MQCARVVQRSLRVKHSTRVLVAVITVAASAPQSTPAQGLDLTVITGIGAGAEDVTGGVLTPFYFKVENGTLTGVAVSAFNNIKGTQHGLTIGLINYARALDGYQVGVINILDRPGRRLIIPLLLHASDR